MKAVIRIATLAGIEYELKPVPMNVIPSRDPDLWLKFLGLHVPGASLSEKTQNTIQGFMRRHNTEALTDGAKIYTLAGGMLAYCTPSAVEPCIVEGGQ